MHTIVFSYNRALQLQAFLRSLQSHVKAKELQVDVIYNSGGGNFEKAYEQLKLEFPGVAFTRRSKIKNISPKYFFTYKKNLYRYFKYPNLRKHLTNFKELLEKVVASSSFETVAFFTDDSIFYRDVSIDSNILEEVAKDKDFKTVYSLRHGINIQPAPTQIKHYGNDHYEVDVSLTAPDLNHWRHLFSIDGHIYRRSMVLPILKKLNYVNPNSLEGFVNDYITNERKGVANRLIFQAQNSLLGFELNQVQTFTHNHNLHFSVQELNDKFMDGFSLTYLYDKDEISDFRPHLSGLNFVHNETGAIEHINFDADFVPAYP